MTITEDILADARVQKIPHSIELQWVSYLNSPSSENELKLNPDLLEDSL